MKAWITKYLFTAGIEEVTGEIAKSVPTMFVVRRGGYDSTYHGEGREWHRTRESAVTRAKEMQQRKIAQLEKSLAKIRAMSLEEVEDAE